MSKEKDEDDPVAKAILESLLDPRNQEILDRLGSDYDADGTPYWEKWERDGSKDWHEKPWENKE